MNTYIKAIIYGIILTIALSYLPLLISWQYWILLISFCILINL